MSLILRMVILEAGMLAPAKSWAGYPQRGDGNAQHRRGGTGRRAGTVTEESGIVTGHSGQGRNRSR